MPLAECASARVCPDNLTENPSTNNVPIARDSAEDQSMKPFWNMLFLAEKLL